MAAAKVVLWCPKHPSYSWIMPEGCAALQRSSCISSPSGAQTVFLPCQYVLLLPKTCRLAKKMHFHSFWELFHLMGVHVALQDECTLCPRTKLFSSSIQLQSLHVNVLIKIHSTYSSHYTEVSSKDWSTYWSLSVSASWSEWVNKNTS